MIPRRKHATLVGQGSPSFPLAPWVWKVAWRSAYGSLLRLSLFAASLTVGIAATVAINSLNYTLQDYFDQKARSMLGADLVISSTQPFADELLSMLDSMELQQAARADILSMVTFTGAGRSQLTRVVALSDPYPLYGGISTLPAGGRQRLKQGGRALLDETLASRYTAQAQDSLKIGDRYFMATGKATEDLAVGGISSMYVPCVYIALQDLEATGLVRYGSRVTYKRFLKIDDPDELKSALNRLRPLLIEYGYTSTTVEQQKQNMGRSISWITHFFSLLAFVSLILGCIGVASSVHTYALEKRNEAAVLRCMGSSGWQAFYVFFVQVFALGLVGSAVGVGVGVGLQQAIAPLLREYALAQATFAIAWRAVGEGLLLGAVVSALFAALPLISIRFVPPLAVLRVGSRATPPFSKARLAILVGAILFPFFGAYYQTGSLLYALCFSVGLGGVIVVLLLIAYALLAATRAYLPRRAGFVLRHALSNLFRPHNQTVALTMSIGMGVFIMVILHVVQYSLLQRTELTGNKDQANVILFDIQRPQKEGALQAVRRHTHSLKQVTPIVTCRLDQINGRTVAALRADSTNDIPDWALTREYRVTYRDTLHTSEKLLSGKAQRLGDKAIPWVTVSERMQETLHLTVGDSLRFDVQGVVMPVRVGGVRSVDWPKDPPNFVFVFPAGALENAPQTWVATARIDNAKQIQPLQRQVVERFPNVSIIDLRAVLNVVNDLLARVGLAVRFLALFSIATALVALAGAIFNSRHARTRENALLRTLGASARQLARIAVTECAYIGFFAAVGGILLALVAGWGLTRFLFEITFSFSLRETTLIGLTTILVTLLVGWFSARNTSEAPPLQVLRKEN